MRIALISEVFSKQMGYLENCLPKYLARLGADVHVITMDLFPYYQMHDFQETFGNFSESERLTPGTVEQYDGYTLHVLPHRKVLGYMRMSNLQDKIRSIRPHIIQTTAAIGWIPLDLSLLKSFYGYKLFTGSHTAASTFPLARTCSSFINKRRLASFFTRYILGRFTSLFTEKCYAVTIDCRDIAVKFFGVQKEKAEIAHLGVDTDIFHQSDRLELIEERRATRKELGIPSDSIVCIYTGKFSEEKNPLIVAEAINHIREKRANYVGLFIGDGVQQASLRKFDSCIVKPFMPFQQLPRFYRASDIAVWPTNESTSMLDAAACGLPLIVSDGIIYREHVTGNGLIYRMNDIEDLEDKLFDLREKGKRESLGQSGAQKMRTHFSWHSIAKKRMKDYESVLIPH